MSKKFQEKTILLLAVSAAALLCGCSSLSKTQLESVAKFSETCDSFSAYPSLIFRELSNIREQSSVWYASSLTQPENRVSELQIIADSGGENEKLIKGVDVSVNILKSYARVLKSLAHNNRVDSPGIEIRSAGRAINTLLTTFNSLNVTKPISTGFLSAAAKIIAYGAELNAERVRAEALRELLPAGDTLVSALCLSLESILKGDELKSLILHEQQMISSNYLSYLRIRGGDIEEDRLFVELIERGNELSKLRTATLTSVSSLRRAHNKLTSQIGEGISLPELLMEIDEFGKEVSKLHKSTMKWYKNR